MRKLGGMVNSLPGILTNLSDHFYEMPHHFFQLRDKSWIYQAIAGHLPPKFELFSALFQPVWGDLNFYQAHRIILPDDLAFFPFFLKKYGEFLKKTLEFKKFFGQMRADCCHKNEGL